MKKRFALLIFFILTAVVLAQRGQLNAPVDVGQVTGFDVILIELHFDYDPATDQQQIDSVRVTAVDGEVTDDGLPNEAFVGHPGGFTYTIQQADLSADFLAAVRNIHKKALNDYGGKKGYPFVP
jgi:hypothetical protein